MATIGSTIPNTTFIQVPYDAEADKAGACGIPSPVNTHEAFKGKKVVVIAVPGAFTPTCHANHIPAFIQQANDFKSKGYSVWVIAMNDPFVMDGWRRASAAKDEINFATDAGLEFSKALDATLDLSSKGLGVRTGRYALIADDLKITHFEKESNPGEVSVSGAKEVLALI